MTPLKAFFISILFLALCTPRLSAQLSVTDSLTAAQLARKLAGPGVVILNPVLTCPGIAEGSFNVTGTSNLGLDSGIILTTGRAKSRGGVDGVNGPRSSSSVVGGPSQANYLVADTFDTDLRPLIDSGIRMYDVCKLEFDFVPNGSTVGFDYVFGSTEYRSYSCSQYNDIFGFFISGPGISGTRNIATIPGTNIPVAVNSTSDPSINPPLFLTSCTNMGPGSPFAQYYVPNSAGMTITYWGFTKVLRASVNLIPCKTYHLKLAISDASDAILDSGVFLKAGSFSSDSVSASHVLDTTFCYRGAFPPLTFAGRTGYPSQRWNDGDTNRIRTIHAPGIYWLRYEDCQVVVDTFKVNGHRAPDLFSLGNDTTICAGNTRVVLHAPVDSNATTFTWQDGSKGNSMKVLQPGTYTLTIANDFCSASDTIVINDRICHCIAVTPTAFTPNRDGRNDHFIPRLAPDCLPAKNFSFRVFDRWGHQVYSAFTADDKGWDGTFHGKESEVGTYFYEVKYIGRETDDEVFEKGDVTLVR